jgi:hypothetical protein
MMTEAVIRSMTYDELQSLSDWYHSLKAWCPIQIAVDGEIAHRATAEWVHFDVFES